MNTEFEAHRSDFPGFPEGPLVLLANFCDSTLLGRANPIKHLETGTV
jgi:hypothetical protein